VQQKEPVPAESDAGINPLTMVIIILLVLILISLVIYLNRRNKPLYDNVPVVLPDNITANQLILFGGFRATDRDGNEITGLFTPKIKELLLFILLNTLKNGTGA